MLVAIEFGMIVGLLKVRSCLQWDSSGVNICPIEWVWRRRAYVGVEDHKDLCPVR